jgi:POT family proton-dependent oligopeptide transporter
VEVPASVFQSVNSTFIILLAPVFAGLWTLLADRKSEPSAPFKFRIGLILVGTGFLVLVLGATLSGGAATPALFVILLYLFHTAAELCFSPVGLAAMTRLSAASMTGLMMGTWFLSTAAGNFLAGVIAQSTESGSAGPGGVISTYAKLGWGAVAVGLLVFVVARPVTRLMRLDLFESDDQPVRH